MQGIYNYTPATNRVSRVYSVAADLYLQYILYFTCQTCFKLSYYYFAMCAVPNMAAFAVPIFRALPVCCSGTV